MNEENGLRGALKYAEISNKNKLNHIFALNLTQGVLVQEVLFLKQAKNNLSRY